ncbi:hypothetical protein HYV22_02715 [Candidatus Gottesmanbacteria bacterium]|nr:hypothetical protein [Candidatus Gottesmanbacteria bacterium]
MKNPLMTKASLGERILLHRIFTLAMQFRSRFAGPKMNGERVEKGVKTKKRILF